MSLVPFILVIAFQAVFFASVFWWDQKNKVEGELPFYPVGEEKESGKVERGPYKELSGMLPEFVRFAKDHYVDERAKELSEDDAIDLKDPKQAALYELQTGRADLSRFIDQEFWDFWQQFAAQTGLDPKGEQNSD